MERRVRVDGHELVLTHPDRVMWPDAGLTKADLIQYYLDVAHVLIPHLSQRYLVFTRYPNGIQEPGFYQKNCPEHAPAWVRTEPYWSPSSRRTLRFVTGASVATLAWLGNQAAVEIHPWLSRSCSRECPDWAVFDLDPSEPAGLPQARTVAGWLKEALDAFGLRGYLKSSGATGFHVYVPLRPLYTYAQSASFVRYLAVSCWSRHLTSSPWNGRWPSVRAKSTSTTCRTPWARLWSPHTAPGPSRGRRYPRRWTGPNWGRSTGRTMRAPSSRASG